MKSGERTAEIKEKLLELEENGKAKASAVMNCGMKNQKVFQKMEELPEDAGYFTTILVKEM